MSAEVCAKFVEEILDGKVQLTYTSSSSKCILVIVSPVYASYQR